MRMLSFLFIFMFPFGIHREPTLQYPFALVEHFLDGPERGKGKYTQQGRYQDIRNEYRAYDAYNAQYQEYPPATGAPMVFSLYHNGVEESDNQKGTDSDNNPRQMIFGQQIHYSDLMGISFLMLCSNEISVSVAVTPGIS